MSSQAVTDGVIITVVSKYKPEVSKPLASQFVFTYKVTIENKNPFAVRLISRFWEIKDSNGNKRNVEGDGVIGKQPIIPSNGVHEYSSWSNIKTPIGSMKGYYVMQRSNDSSLFKAAIPLFTMQEFSTSN